MVTLGNERYLRSILYLSDGGSFITKAVIQRELVKKGCTLNELLKNAIHENKVKNEFKNKMQQDIIYPTIGNTCLSEWDIQMLTGIILIIFRHDLQPDERKNIRDIKRLRIQLAHSPTGALSDEEYNDFVSDLDDAITKLVSFFEDDEEKERLQNKSKETFDQYKTCPLEVKTSIEELKRLNDTEPLITKLLDSIEKTKINISETIKGSESNIRSDIEGVDVKLNLVLKQLEKNLQTKPFQRESIIVNTKLTFSGDVELLVKLADKVTINVFNRAIQKTKNTEEMAEIERAVDDILQKLDEMEGVKVLTAEPECIIMRIQCDTFKSVYDVLQYISSDKYKQQLNILAGAVDSYIKRVNPITVTSEIEGECLHVITSMIENDGKEESNFLSNQDEGTESLFADDHQVNDERLQHNRGCQQDTVRRSEILDNNSYIPGKDDVVHDVQQDPFEDINISGANERHVHPYRETTISAAIDIGSRFTALAYSFNADFKRDHLKIHMFHDWTNSTGVQVDKVPTVALFDDKNKFHSFGYEAEIKYAELLEKADDEGKDCRWRFFKALSFNVHQNEEYLIKDDQDQPMAAVDVFTEMLVFVKDKLFRYLSEKLPGLFPHDIHWILAVSSQDSEREFLEEVIKRTRDKHDFISFVPRPQAAILYCKELHVTNDMERRLMMTIKWMNPGEQFIVVDAGYRNFSMTVHRLEMDGSVSEIAIEDDTYFSWSGAGELIDKQLDILLNEIFGVRELAKFREDCKLDALELKDNGEMMKTLRKDLENQKNDFTTRLTIPSGLLTTFKDLNGFNFSESQVKLEDRVYVPSKGSRIYFSNDSVIDLFAKSKKELSCHLRDLLKDTGLRDVNTIIFIGGLADSEIIRNEIRQSFHKMNLIFPDKASTAVLQGAVLYGHTTNENYLSK